MVPAFWVFFIFQYFYFNFLRLMFGYSAYAFKFGLCKTMVLNRVFIERKMK